MRRLLGERLTTKLALLAAVLLAAASAQAAVYTWIPDANGNWSDSGNWSSTPADYPNDSTADAQIQLDITANRTITLSEDIQVNALRFTDTGGGTDSNVIVQPSTGYTLSFTGTNPTIESGTGANHGLNIYTPIDISAAGLTHVGGGVTRLGGGITGDVGDDLTLSNGSIEMSGQSPGFSGDIIVESGRRLQARSIQGSGADTLGDTTGITIINGTGWFETRDSSNKTISEPFVLNGIRTGGSLRCYAGGSNTINGPVTLNSDSSFSVADWKPSSDTVGHQRLFYIDSVIADGSGGPHSVYFLGDLNAGSAQGTQGRLSEMIVGGVSTYGGNTYLTTNKADDGSGTFSGTLRLGIDNPLPTGTTLSIGGDYSTAGGTLGTGVGNGRFVLNGHSQELAGLVTGGTGAMNRVVGNSATLSTLTLNIAPSTTNTYDGYLGWTDTDDNNLALVKTGDGTLELTKDNTYAGPTTVAGGTLLVNGTHTGGGPYTVQNGATLGGTGTIGLASGAGVTFEGGSFAAPGSSPGTLSVTGDVTMADGSTYLWELGASASDTIDLTGTLTLDDWTLRVLDDGGKPFPVQKHYLFTGFTGLELSGGSNPSSYNVTFDLSQVPDWAAYTNLADLEIIEDSQGLYLTGLASVPEPASLGLLALGALALAASASRRKRRV